ncbi:MAG: hypothetical protein O7C98_02390 [Planctomycetota bacterium]|nr:hypothetical protein [Planctomycetota bacterium]
MRMFLPIKGPDGRYLTRRETVALLVLGCTLILCVLTLMAGERAYAGIGAQNPILAFVSLPSRLLGGGIVALYGVVLLWSALVYLRGEWTLEGKPLSGRLVAALCVCIAMSGVLAVAGLSESAGSLGRLVGESLANTLGGAAGIVLLLAMTLVGLNLAAGGAWAAASAPARVVASPYPGTPTAPTSAGVDWLGTPAATKRGAGTPPLPDDGDPTREDRSFAVLQAMEEIERSKGVTIIEIDPEAQEALAHEVAAATGTGETEDEADTDEDETEEASTADTEDDEDRTEDETEEASTADPGDDEDGAPNDSSEPTDPYKRPGRLENRPDTDGGDNSSSGHSGSYDWRGRPIG